MRRNYAIVCVSIILLSIRKNHCFKSKPTDASAVSLCLQTLEGLTILGMGDVEGRGGDLAQRLADFFYLWLCKVVLNVLWVQISIFSWQIRWLDPPPAPSTPLPVLHFSVRKLEWRAPVPGKMSHEGLR